jgi:hypothetical protein
VSLVTEPNNAASVARGWPQEVLWDDRAQDVEFREYEPSSFPFTLYACPVCAALVSLDGLGPHQEWHETTDLAGEPHV